MPSKKVFSKKKFEARMISDGLDPSNYTWPDLCEGLTAQEMTERHQFDTFPEWMVEVEA